MIELGRTEEVIREMDKLANEDNGNDTNTARRTTRELRTSMRQTTSTTSTVTRT